MNTTTSHLLIRSSAKGIVLFPALYNLTRQAYLNNPKCSSKMYEISLPSSSIVNGSSLIACECSSINDQLVPSFALQIGGLYFTLKPIDYMYYDSTAKACIADIKGKEYFGDKT